MIRDAASQRQVDAADPVSSTWLSANAGSGKTRVLTDRVARLLLQGVAPQNILCLTYTKAAATEMQNRLFKTLGKWAMRSNDMLRDDLANLGLERSITAADLGNARTLFARAIETPGGLKIQTIHSFCASVLRRFPLEAEVSPQFREMEDRAAELLRAEVVDQLIDGPDAAVVRDLLAHFTGDDLARLTAEVARKQDQLSTQASGEVIKTSLGLAPDATREDALGLAFQGDEAEIAKEVAEAFSTQSATYKKFAQTLSQLDYKNPDWAGLETLFGLFLYSGTCNSKSVNFPQSNHTKAVEALDPIADAVHDWMDRTAAARAHLWAMDAADKTLALYAFAAKFIPAYAARKQAMGALDFDDLIRKTKALLTDRSVAEWVLFRLDGGTDHILVDEAQDTNPDQWDVIRLLAEEFLSGEGARADRDRTLFVVGDKKQSIYSFQGADPAAFDRMQDHFNAAHTAVEKPFNITSLDHSFRSSQAILSVVDETFVRERAAGMDDSLTHIAFKENMPGRVDLWPVIEPSKTDDTGNWYDPVDAPSATDHTVLMAKRVADQIKHMIAHETIPVEVENSGHYKRRKITEGDVLILVQRRSELFSEIIRACKNAGLHIAGADRLRVGAELAVKDLVALLNFLALPEDDLSLASALRSPLFGWSEQDLFTLSHQRKGYLWIALRDADYPQTLAVLRDLLDKADFLRPFDLIERILTRHDGRRNLLARLGQEAEDGIDALLSQALAYESNGVPSLTGFLTWMETDDLEVKRQMDSQGDRIRVMTVHGSKGLEAPIVILPDTAKREIRVNDELFAADGTLVWKTPKAQSAPAMLALYDSFVARQARERLRLLYVAMTRAEKWLIVGAAGDVGEGDASWYNIIADGMRQRGDYDVISGGLETKRVSYGDWDGLVETHAEKAPVVDVPMPAFGPTPLSEISKTISPSQVNGAKTLPGELADEDEEDAKERGTMIHRLLEHLPMVSPQDRVSLGHKLVGAHHAALVPMMIDLLDSPSLAHLWTPGALTEVDITADIPGLGRIHGAIDRLIIEDGRILAIDYKSNRIVPDTPERTPAGLLGQMAIYQAALEQIYPDKDVQAVILWTQSAELMLLPASLLHDALSVVTIA
ncbi:double-strand break repair helicase AddA [Yoonia sediminilitoris]|uniref:DNA 3'-5' helicase n=1 Tax=Yoonia sediminilitoris TaxID=1286148 RepID=A0A2T6KLU7_9RHOB|nr:double-strand break repair helicase AddA [Yoonia sediminilitoris]PUB17195.1 DNA helicase/exodeoxyribonuclease V subunit A [Yoonia sediminilitoris]RCW97490.1 DNA helicase/exodeoxyribonuclease V subunit A [Yoonia sediminilitoris]